MLSTLLRASAARIVGSFFVPSFRLFGLASMITRAAIKLRAWADVMSKDSLAYRALP